MSPKRPLKASAIAEELDTSLDVYLSEADDSDADPDYVPFEGFHSEDEEDIDPPDDLTETLDTMNLQDIEEESDSEDLAPTWSEFSNRTQHFPFTGKEHICMDLPDNITPIEVFQLYFDDEVIELIVEQTNIYAEQVTSKMKATQKGKSRHVKWTPTSKEEIKAFIGLILWMGLNRLPIIADYWSNDPLYQNSIASNKMSRNRFQLLLSCIHFADNSKIGKGDRIGKIQPLVEMLKRKFQAVFTPGDEVVIDETLVPWRGRLVFKQYIPNKAHKYGIKLFKLCSKEGYTHNLSIYSGQSEDGSKRVGLAKQVCTNLMVNLLNEGRTLFVDNFYTSYELAYSFIKKKTHVIGTLRAKKKSIPKEVLDAKLRKGDIVSREDENGIMVLKWKDQRDVRMLSTKHSPEMVEIGMASGDEEIDADQPGPSSRRSRTRKRRRVSKKPAVILSYNKGKCGIDISDQMAAYDTPLRKGIKCYRKLGFALLLCMSVVNAWIVYNLKKGKKIKIKNFREEITRALLGVELPKRHPKPKCNLKHFLKHMISEDGKRIRRACKLCYEEAQQKYGRIEARKKTNKVYTHCPACDNKPFLCITCFEKHHKR